MGPRNELSRIFENILGNTNVYFEPPENVKLKYPCIVYSKSVIEKDYAGNKPYLMKQRYMGTLIYLDPDSDLPTKMALIPYCRNTNHFIVDNLYHDTYEIYY